MQDINKSLDEKLFAYLEEKEIGLFKYYQKFFFLPKYHNKNNFKNVSSFFEELNHHQYYGDIRFDKKSLGRDIFIYLYSNSDENEKLVLLKNAFHFLTFTQTINFLIKENKDKAIHFFTHYSSNGKLKTPEEEEELLKKLKKLDNDNFYYNLLSYLTNNGHVYLNSIYKNKYQSILKDIVNENFPEKRSNFSVFIGDNIKKELSSNSLFSDGEEFETIIKLNKTYFDENFNINSIEIKNERAIEKERVLNKIENILKESRKFDFSEVVKFYPNNKEISHMYLKHKINYNKKEIEHYLESCLKYWNDNIIELRKMTDEDMIREISHKGEKILFYKEMSEKLDEKEVKEKKVKI